MTSIHKTISFYLSNIPNLLWDEYHLIYNEDELHLCFNFLIEEWSYISDQILGENFSKYGIDAQSLIKSIDTFFKQKSIQFSKKNINDILKYRNEFLSLKEVKQYLNSLNKDSYILNTKNNGDKTIIEMQKIINGLEKNNS